MNRKIIMIYIFVLCNHASCINKEDTDSSGNEEDSDASEIAGTEWMATIHPSDQEPNIVDAPARLFIPKQTQEAKAVLVYCSHALGVTEYTEYDWRETAAANDYVLLVIQFKANDGNDVAWAFPEQASLLLLQALEQMAELSGHEEIGNVPIITWGHSSGGMLFTTMASFIPERIAGIVAYHGVIKSYEMEEASVMRSRVLSDEFVKVPILALVGEFDPTWIMSSAEDLVYAESEALGRR
jgi:hypothetical protein